MIFQKICSTSFSLNYFQNVQVSEFPSCPICLYPPVAAKMTHCGHIYCWSCMLHYLALSDKSSRKCPICFENVHKNDLKSVIPIPHNSFNLNDEITFKLMKRKRGSLIAYPADQQIDDDKFLFSVSDTSITNLYCKLLLATRNDVLKIIDRENNELKNQLTLDENAPEKCFIEEAINLLSVRTNDLLQNLTESTSTSTKGNEFTKFENAKRERFESVGSDNVEDLMKMLSVDDREASCQQATKIFYFYQGKTFYMSIMY